MKIFISVVNKVLYTERLRLKVQPLTLFMYHFLTEKILLRDLSEVSRGEGGRWKQREGHNFLRLRKAKGHEKWADKRGRVMQIYARDHVEAHT